MSLIYANLCKNIQIWHEMTIFMPRMTNGIQNSLYLHVFDIKASIFPDIGKIFSYTLTDASNLYKFMEKFSQIAQKYHRRAEVPLTS